MRFWAARDPDELLDWGLAAKGPNLRSRAASIALQTTVDTDPAGAEKILDRCAPYLMPNEVRQQRVGLIYKLGEKDPARAVRRLMANSRPTYNTRPFKALLVAWAAADRAGFLQWFRNQGDAQWAGMLARGLADDLMPGNVEAAMAMTALIRQPDYRKAAYDQIFAEWARADMPAFRKTAMELADPELRNRANLHVVRHLAGHSQAAAIEYAKGLPPAAQTRELLTEILNRTWDSNFERVLDFLRGLSPSVPRDEVMVYAAGRLAPVDHVRALEFADSLGEGNLQQRLLAEVISKLAAKDGPAATKLLVRLTKAVHREEAIKNLAFGWSKYDSRAAAEWSLTLPSDGVARSVHYSVFSRLQLEGPEQAAAYLSRLPKGDARVTHILALAQKWLVGAPEKAEAWLRQFDEDELAGIAPNLAGSIAREQPMIAARWYRRCPPGRRSSSTLSTIVQEWGKTDPAQAFAWLGTLEGRSTRYAYASLATQWAKKDPRAALAAMESIADERARGQARVAAFREFGKVDPMAALTQANEIKREIDRGNIRRPIILDWRVRDREAATEWILGSAPGPAREECLLALIGSIWSRYPEQAVILVAELAGPEVRGRQYDLICRHWLQLAPLAARQWIASAPLPEAVKAQLVK